METKQLIVQKFGGATLATPAHIKNVAKRICEDAKQFRLLIVVSAMGSTTNDLLTLAHQISEHPPQRELDMLITTGERVSMALVSMALNNLNCPAVSFTGSQAGIITDDHHYGANIISVTPYRVQKSLDEGKIVVLAGFQGVSDSTKEITTLGRGGSDISAVAMASALNAKRCEILKEVPSVFSADPKIFPQAVPLKELSYDQLIEMTFWGAKVINYRCAQMAKDKNVTLYIGPADTAEQSVQNQGTLVQNNLYSNSLTRFAVNSHEYAAKYSKTISHFENEIQKFGYAFPQILRNTESEILFCGSAEVMLPIYKTLGLKQISTVSITLLKKSDDPEKMKSHFDHVIQKNNIQILHSFITDLGIHFEVPTPHRQELIKAIMTLSLLGND